MGIRHPGGLEDHICGGHVYMNRPFQCATLVPAFLFLSPLSCMLWREPRETKEREPGIEVVQLSVN